MTATRAHLGGELFLALVGFAVVVPVVMAVRRIRLGVARRGGSTRPVGAAGRKSVALPGPARDGRLTGTFFVWRIFAPDAYSLVVGAFWVGLAATAVLVAVPRTRLSVATTVLALLGSVFLAVQLAGVVREPADPVWIGVPVTGDWQVANGGRSTLVNAHHALGVQRDALDVAARSADERTAATEPAHRLLRLRPAAARRRRRTGHCGRRRRPRRARRRQDLAEHGRQPRDPRHRRRTLRALRAPQAGQRGSASATTSAAARCWARSATPATPTLRTCTCRCRTGRLRLRGPHPAHLPDDPRRHRARSSPGDPVRAFTEG